MPRAFFLFDALLAGLQSATMKLKVECSDDRRGEAEPRVFYLKARRIVIIEIIDRWLSPNHCYFKVQADDGGIYILRCETPCERWELTLFQAANRR